MIAKIYKDIKFTKANQYYFKTKTERDAFLDPYRIHTQDYESMFNPTTSYIQLALPKTIDGNIANYCCLINPVNNEEFYYYIQSVEIVHLNSASNDIVYGYTLLPDYWQTYFNRYTGTNNLEHPTLNDVRFKASTWIPSNLCTEYEPYDTINVSNTTYSMQEYYIQGDHSNKYAILYVCSLGSDLSSPLTRTDGGTFTFIQYDLDDRFYALNEASKTGTFTDLYEYQNNQNVKHYKVTIQNVYIVPQEFLVDYNLGDVLYYKRSTSDTTRLYAAFTVPTGALPYKIITHTFSLNKGYKYYTIGTFNNRINVGYKYQYKDHSFTDNRLLNFKIKTSIVGSEISIILEANADSIDITQDFSIPFTINEYNQYVSQHKTSLALQGVGNILSMAGGIAAGNPFMIANSVQSAISGGASLLEKKNAPTSLANRGQGSSNIAITTGIALFYNEIINGANISHTENEYGCRFDEFEESLNIPSSPVGKSSTHIYIEADCELRKFSNTIRQNIQEMLSNGVKINYVLSN